MRKARIMLTVITLFTIGGGAFAFNANLRNGNLFCTSVVGGECAKDAADVYLKHKTSISGFLSYCSTNSTHCSTILTLTRVVSDPR